MSELALALFWPAVIGYGEAAVAYVGAAALGARLTRAAIWGVRVGWIAQTGLLVAQAIHADGFVWGSAAASLNLFVWMCVTLYLVWGCRRPFRVVGLGLMPLAAVLLAVAWASGGVEASGSPATGSAFLVAHVGLVIGAFAGFTVAAAMAAAYLWQERQLRGRRPAAVLTLLPSLRTLDSLVGRTIAASMVALSIGAGLGLARVQARGGSLDAIAATTILAWGVYAAYLVARWEAGWLGRRSALLALAGFAVVITIRVALIPVGHS